MGGEIFLYSAPYEGSAFYFTLPPYCIDSSMSQHESFHDLNSFGTETG